MTVAALRFKEIDERNRAVETLDLVAARLAAGILCSRDPEVMAVEPELRDLIPAHFAGVTRSFLPLAPAMPSDGVGRFSAYTSRLGPAATVAERRLEASHGALKMIVGGSVRFRDHTLGAGDWLWIGSGESYGFSAGDEGAAIFTVLPCVAETESDGAIVALFNARAPGAFVSSRDPGVADSNAKLGQVERIAEQAEGVTHSFFPYAPAMPVTDVEDGRFFAWLATIEPGTVIPAHTHELEKIADYKVVISGSIICRGRELTAGDWLWAPAGGSYAFTVGDKGAVLLAGWPWN